MISSVLLLVAATNDAQSVYTSPAGKAASTAYLAAFDCAKSFAASASLDRTDLPKISWDAEDACKTERIVAVKSMLSVISGATGPNATDNLRAKMRRAADGALIERLESGAAVKGLPVDYPAIAVPLARYVGCLRVAVTQKMEGIYLGEDWLLTKAKLSEAETVADFVAVGRELCVNSRSSYSAALDEIRKTDPVIDKSFGLEIVERAAVGPYLKAVPRPQ